MKLRISSKNKYLATIELEDLSRGILPIKQISSLYPSDYEGEISESEANQIIKMLEDYAFNLLVKYLAKEEHSQYQCVLYLQRKGFCPEIIQNAVNRCLNLNYINDQRFAELLISSYINRKASKRAIIAKLSANRIPINIWKPILEKLYTEEEKNSNLEELLNKYYLAHKDLPPEKLKERAFGYLYRKGFDPDDIREAIENLP
ncbi:MAG TPA: regulatory protein RecX [Candidatus Syntrophosphaera thermopropionivorans]|nr:regulatory protein RecX [Candidatus Syntrophosphaera thermopropionivorans]